jgi:hypothetical protein
MDRRKSRQPWQPERLLHSGLVLVPGKKIFACTPNQSVTQVFLSVDKNLHQQALEVSTTRLAVIVGAALGDRRAEELYAMRGEGLLFHDCSPLAKVEVEPQGKVLVGWNPSIADPLQLNRADIVKTLEAECLAAASNSNSASGLRCKSSGTQWCL